MNTSYLLAETASDPAIGVQVYMVAQDASGNAQPLVSVLQGIVTPNTQPPTFLFLNFTAPVVDQNTGFFAIDMIVNTSVVAKIYYSIYRCSFYICPSYVHAT